jgi:hypothetical protein
MNGLIAVRISRPLSQEELLVSVIFGGNVFIPTDSTTQRYLQEEIKRAHLLLGPIDLEIIQALLGSDRARVPVLSRKYRKHRSRLERQAMDAILKLRNFTEIQHRLREILGFAN